MLDFHWIDDRSIVADFTIPRDKSHLFRVRFKRVEVVRLVDEMPLSTEAETSNEGLRADHLAYSVENSSFWLAQSEALRLSVPSLKHYRFITGWMCLDVISNTAPSFAVIPRLEG
jgi:hypothetical protein